MAVINEDSENLSHWGLLSAESKSKCCITFPNRVAFDIVGQREEQQKIESLYESEHIVGLIEVKIHVPGTG